MRSTNIAVAAAALGLTLAMAPATAATAAGTTNAAVTAAGTMNAAVTAAGTTNAAVTAARLDAAIAGAHRSDAAKARDRYRNPKETLLFFGLRPEMTVVEISPGAGWYSDIIAPVVKGSGKYLAAHNNPEGSDGQKKQRAAFEARMAENAAIVGPVTVTSFGKGIEGNIAPAGSADLVLTFRNVHNWMGADFAPAAFKAFYDALKPGGTLGVVEHRMPETREMTDAARSSGYVRTSDVVKMAEAAGFKLDAKSEINANPKDSADWPGGVWTLPPVLRGGEADRAKYLAIGESDRMTLRFVKPAS